MQLTPEQKKQLDEQKKQCVFCKLISGEMKAKTVFEDSKTIAMLDIYPALKGHTLFMPKEHYPIAPYMSPEESAYLYGLLPQMTKAVMGGIISTGCNIFIANGGVAGQQAPHFLIHILPREEKDGFFNFFFDKRKAVMKDDKKQLFVQNFPAMMGAHFKRSPASWHTGSGGRSDKLKDVATKNTLLYEDEKVLVIVPAKGVVEGHIEIYSKEETKDFSKLNGESGAHLFTVASMAASALFEGLGAQGTNIVIKSGNSDDNPGSGLVAHVLARFADDSLKDMHWQPKPATYNLDSIQSKIKDKTWNIKAEKVKEVAVVKPAVSVPAVVAAEPKTLAPHQDEIKKAIERMYK
ncbi:HIT domain-containing protein [Candidatus Woesearchaeota archaeon]|nr:HIT domain-containing protein [Candidatus Woesearchaeota archaeon]